MEQTQRRAWPSVGTIIVALLTGILAFLVLFSAGGTNTQPPDCYSFLFYPVPCERWVAPLGAIAIAVAVGIALWWTIDRRKV